MFGVVFIKELKLLLQVLFTTKIKYKCYSMLVTLQYLATDFIIRPMNYMTNVFKTVFWLPFSKIT